MWRIVYTLLVFLRIYLVFKNQNGYIHPDEFFQGPEKISGDVFQYDIHKAWEFDEKFPVRSPFIWYLTLWYPFNMMKLLKAFGIIQFIDSYYLILVPRLMMTFLSLLTDSSIMRIAARIGSPPYLAGCISATSYINLVFYTRTFSNSVESLFTALLLVTVIEYISLCRECEAALKSFDAETPGGDNSSRNLSDCTSDQGVPEAAYTSTQEEDCHVRESEEKTNQGKPVPIETNGKVRKDTDENSAWSSIPLLDSNSCQQDVDKSSMQLPPDEQTDKQRGGEVSDDLDLLNVEMDTLMSRTHLSANKTQPDDKTDRKDIVNKYLLSKNKLNLLISSIIMAGVWNRPTFVGFAAIPVLYWFFQGCLPRNAKSLGLAAARCLYNLPSLFNVSLILVLFDTSYYRSHSNSQSFHVFDHLVITPLNFIIYNKNSKPQAVAMTTFLLLLPSVIVVNVVSIGFIYAYLFSLMVSYCLFRYCSANLAEHGLHPRYLHCLVNAPLLLGQKNILCLLFFTTVTPLCLLSVFPHQEPRFILPLLVPCAVLSAYCLDFINSRILYAIFIVFWLLHNFLFGILFGYLHQAGVVPSMLYLHKMKINGVFNDGASIVYHRTYMPPKSLLQLSEWESRHIKLIDLQGGVEDSDLDIELQNLSNLYMVTPYNKGYLEQLIGARFTIKKEASFYPHLSTEDPPIIREDLIVYDSSGAVDINEQALQEMESSMTLKMYKLTNRMLIVQMYPQAGDAINQRQNLDAGAYETLSITLPKVKTFFK